jgi:putative nucleotidyltransferase with HDIG domain
VADLDRALADKLTEIVLAKIASDKLVLPALPTVVVKCLELLRNSNVGLKQIARQIERDPLLAAAVVRVANSAAFGGSGVHRSLDQAITYLGTARVRTLLLDVSARQVFTSRDPAIAQRFQGTVDHSVAVAVLARDVAALTAGCDPDVAYLAGLLHDVGKPLLGSMLLEAERQITGMRRSRWIGSASWSRVLELNHRKVGSALARGWGLPAEIARGIEDCADYDPSDRLCVPNVVRFANAVAKQSGMYDGPVDTDDVDSLVMLGRTLLGVDDEPVQRLVASVREQMAA